jgi:uncharacterized caspase-like protein
MGSSTSLTDAVKAAATQGTSLTDAVKEAARSGTDATVISFPRAVPDLRPQTAVPVVLPAPTAPPGSDASAQVPLEPAPEPDLLYLSEFQKVPEAEPVPAPPRKFRLRGKAGSPPPAVRLRSRFRRLRGALPFRAALGAFAAGCKVAAVKLAGFAIFAGLAMVAVPSPVGSGSDGPIPIAAQKRVALVIGNSAYRYTRRLENPRNDAADIGAALQRLGFQTIEGFDLDKTALDGRIRAFMAALRGADVGVFFYAGHGLHVAGQNYLVPVDAQLMGASALDAELVRLDLVHRSMEREARTNILFFDACRDSPLSDNLARAIGTRSAEIGRGLGLVRGSAGTLISFSTQPGTVALDGKGRNSPYSAALARQLATSHEDLGTMLIAVRNDVMKETDRRQVPWEHSALTGRFYFNPAADTAGRTAGASSPASAAHEAFEAWSAAKDTTSLAVLDAYAARYGDTFYAELARARMADLRRHGLATAAPSIARLAPTFDP